MKISHPAVYLHGRAFGRSETPDPPLGKFYCDEEAGLFIVNHADRRRSLYFSYCLPMPGRKGKGRLEMFRGHRRKQGTSWQIAPKPSKWLDCADCRMGFHCRRCVCCMPEEELKAKVDKDKAKAAREEKRAARKAANAEKLKGVPF